MDAAHPDGVGVRRNVWFEGETTTSKPENLNPRKALPTELSGPLTLDACSPIIKGKGVLNRLELWLYTVP